MYGFITFTTLFKLRYFDDTYLISCFTADTFADGSAENAGVEIKGVECVSWRGCGVKGSKRIIACISRYDNGAYSRMQFLTAVSHSMGAHRGTVSNCRQQQRRGWKVWVVTSDNVRVVRIKANWTAIYTVRHKKLHPSYWYNNFANLCHTVMIFGT